MVNPLVISKNVQNLTQTWEMKDPVCCLAYWTFKTNIGQLNKRNGLGGGGMLKSVTNLLLTTVVNGKATLGNSLPVYSRSAAFVWRAGLFPWLLQLQRIPRLK